MNCVFGLIHRLVSQEQTKLGKLNIIDKRTTIHTSTNKSHKDQLLTTEQLNNSFNTNTPSSESYRNYSCRRICVILKIVCIECKWIGFHIRVFCAPFCHHPSAVRAIGSTSQHAIKTLIHSWGYDSALIPLIIWNKLHLLPRQSVKHLQYCI
jgi:hypothetical protein